MSDMTREQAYRRWKKGEDQHALAKEMGVTRERMRLILKKMDENVPLVDNIEALEAENARLRGALERYADESNWIETSAVNDDPHDGWLRDVWDGGADGWTEARAALQDKGKNQ